MSFQQILVAVDEDPVSAHAARIGLDLAKCLGAKLALVYVIDPSSAALPDTGIPPSELVSLRKQDAKRLLAGFRQNAASSDTPLEFVQVGTPATEIVRTATEWPADLVVIGSHGRRGLSRALLGSVAEAVMRHALCPVLIARASARVPAAIA
jgi:nucleotide-binding universal stress UspA family protein